MTNGKRIKAYHRAEVKAGNEISLKEFARTVEEEQLAAMANSWFESKRSSSQAEARKAHRERVSTLRAMKPPKENKGKKK